MSKCWVIFRAGPPHLQYLLLKILYSGHSQSMSAEHATYAPGHFRDDLDLLSLHSYNLVFHLLQTRHDSHVSFLPEQEWTPTIGARSAKDTWQMQSSCEGFWEVWVRSQHCKLLLAVSTSPRNLCWVEAPGERACC